MDKKSIYKKLMEGELNKPLNEKKNPKREKVKKDFKTSLKFAKGVIRKIDTFMKENGGLITKKDLKNYRPIWRETLRGNFNEHEIEILKKISEWPKCVEISSNKLEPHRIPFYLYELATLFHAYWNLGNNTDEFRFIKKLTIPAYVPYASVGSTFSNSAMRMVKNKKQFIKINQLKQNLLMKINKFLKPLKLSNNMKQII